MKKENTLSISRVYDSPLKFVWEAWTDADHIAEWWAPQGVDMVIEKHDFAPKGEWLYFINMPDGTKMQMDGIYQEIDEFVKIVTTANMRPYTIDTIMEIDFVPLDNKTEVKLSVHHNSEHEKQKQDEMGFEKGWDENLDRLGRYLNSFFL